MKMSTNKMKRRGVFYSPSDVADLLVDWAVRTPNERILEPSFGGCEFLSSIERRLVTLGSIRPWRQMFGCDVDANAFKQHLARLQPRTLRRGQFIKEDFL